MSLKKQKDGVMELRRTGQLLFTLTGWVVYNAGLGWERGSVIIMIMGTANAGDSVYIEGCLVECRCETLAVEPPVTVHRPLASKMHS